MQWKPQRQIKILSLRLVLIDDKGLISIELGAFGVPETYIINNQEKKIIKKYVGPIDEIKSKEIELLVKSWKP